jgi:hypothetical protein
MFRFNGSCHKYITEKYIHSDMTCIKIFGYYDEEYISQFKYTGGIYYHKKIDDVITYIGDISNVVVIDYATENSEFKLITKDEAETKKKEYDELKRIAAEKEKEEKILQEKILQRKKWYAFKNLFNRK